MYDTGKDSWDEVKDEFGATIEGQLRTYAKALQIVTLNALKNKKERPLVYLNWLGKALKKVYFLHFN